MSKIISGMTCHKAIWVSHSMGGLVARYYSEVTGGRIDLLGIVHGMMPTPGAPAANLLSKGVDGTSKNLYLMASMFSTDQWIVERPLKGTSMQFINLLAEEMRLAIPANKRPSRNQMRRALREMLKRTGQYDQLGSQHFVFVDRARLAAISDGQGAGRSTAERILHSREPIVLAPRNIREGIMPGFQQAMNGEVRMNAVSLFFSGISWYYAGKALDSANSFSRRELSVKFWTSLAGVVGGLCETVDVRARMID